MGIVAVEKSRRTFPGQLRAPEFLPQARLHNGKQGENPALQVNSRQAGTISNRNQKEQERRQNHLRRSCPVVIISCCFN